MSRAKPLEPCCCRPRGDTRHSRAETEQAEIDWQKRYSDLQPEYTRVSQEPPNSGAQQELYDALLSTDDADTRRAIAEELGYQLEDDETEPDPDEDPLEQYGQRLERSNRP